MTISLIVSHFLLFQYKATAIEPWDKFNITTDHTSWNVGPMRRVKTIAISPRAKIDSSNPSIKFVMILWWKIHEP